MLLILRACASDWPLGASPEWEGRFCRVRRNAYLYSYSYLYSYFYF